MTDARSLQLIEQAEDTESVTTLNIYNNFRKGKCRFDLVMDRSGDKLIDLWGAYLNRLNELLKRDDIDISQMVWEMHNSMALTKDHAIRVSSVYAGSVKNEELTITLPLVNDVVTCSFNKKTRTSIARSQQLNNNESGELFCVALGMMISSDGDHIHRCHYRYRNISTADVTVDRKILILSLLVLTVIHIQGIINMRIDNSFSLILDNTMRYVAFLTIARLNDILDRYAYKFGTTNAIYSPSTNTESHHFINSLISLIVKGEFDYRLMKMHMGCYGLPDAPKNSHAFVINESFVSHMRTNRGQIESAHFAQKELTHDYMFVNALLAISHAFSVISTVIEIMRSQGIEYRFSNIEVIEASGPQYHAVEEFILDNSYVLYLLHTENYVYYGLDTPGHNNKERFINMVNSHILKQQNAAQDEGSGINV